MFKMNIIENSWGILSELQNIYNFSYVVDNPKVLEIGPGKGLLLDKIIEIYGSDNVYGMQPINNEYSNYNDILREKLKDNFIESTLEDYSKDDLIKFDIIYIFKWNISLPGTDDFIEALSKIINKNGIIYISSVERYRLYYENNKKEFYIIDKIRKYFNIKILRVENINYYKYGSLIIAPK